MTGTNNPPPPPVSLPTPRPALTAPPDLRLVEIRPGIRLFSNERLQAQIDTVLSTLPTDRRAAVIDVGADEKGIIAVAAIKLDGGWSIMGAFDQRYGGDWNGRAGVRWVGK